MLAAAEEIKKCDEESVRCGISAVIDRAVSYAAKCGQTIKWDTFRLSLSADRMLMELRVETAKKKEADE